MNLKKHFNIVFDTRKFGGDRKMISVNRLAVYIGEKRANFILAKLPYLKCDRIVCKVQNKGSINVYSK